MTGPRALPELTGEVVNDLLRRAGRATYDRWAQQVESTGGCTCPIRLTGRVVEVDRRTGDIRTRYTTWAEPDDTLLTRCGNRRASVCPPCADLYRYDTHQLISAGLRGGKGVPAGVAEHPRVFVTLTAPSFGAVHTTRERNGRPAPCHPSRGRAVTCPHGRLPRCASTHVPGDSQLGRPLCADCYDYAGSVLFNALAPDLWRRTTTYLRLHLARRAGVSVQCLRQRVRLSYAKVAEYQRRGVVHLHAVVRLDGADPRWVTPPPTCFDVEMLTGAVRDAVAAVRLPPPHGETGTSIRWGEQLDVREIRSESGDDELSEAAVAAYVAKYATKAAEEAGAPPRRLTGREDLDRLGVDPHVAEMIRTCWRLAGHPELAALRLDRWAHMLGFRGHFSTKSRRYSVTLGALRQARADYRAREGQQHDAEASNVEETVLVVGEWQYAGSGYCSSGDALLAASAAARARDRREVSRLVRCIEPDLTVDGGAR